MQYTSKKGLFAAALLLSGAAVFSAACGSSGSSDRSGTTAGAPGSSGASTGGAGPVAGASGISSTAGASGGTAMACDPAVGCCKTTACTCPYPAGAVANSTIDDLEDGMVKGWKTATVMTATGYWDFSNDMTGTVTPLSTAALMAAAPGANSTGKSLHVSGDMHTKWGAALAAELSNGCPFDASAYGGISFWAKGTSTVLEGTNKLLVLVGMPEFIPVAQGGFCADEATNPVCYARHRVLIDLTPDWKQYTIAWTDLAAPTYLTNGPAFNANRIRDIVFNASGPSSDPKLPPTSFDFSIDELKFVAPGTPGTVGMTGTAGTGAGGAATAGAGGASAGAGGASAGAGGATAGTGGVAGG